MTEAKKTSTTDKTVYDLWAVRMVFKQCRDSSLSSSIMTEFIFLAFYDNFITN